MNLKTIRGLAGESLEERLEDRFEEELRRAELDYVGIDWLARRRPAGRRRTLTRLPIYAAALVVAAIVGAQLPGLWRGSVAPAASQTPSASFQPMPDLLPTELAGERVYRVGDVEVASGRSVLVAGSIYDETPARSCPSPSGSEAEPVASGTNADRLLTRAGCLPGSRRYLVGPGGRILVAVLGTQPQGHETVVVRAHTKDPMAQQCSFALRSECEKTLVIESIEWRMAMPVQVGKWPVAPADAERPDRVDVFAMGGVLQERDCTSSDPDAGIFVGVNQQCATIDDLPVVGSDRLRQAYGRTVVLLVDGAAPQYSCDRAVSRPICDKTLVAIQVIWPSGLVQGQQVVTVDGVPRYVDGAQVLWPGTLALDYTLNVTYGKSFLVVGVPVREAGYSACPAGAASPAPKGTEAPAASAAACEPEPFAPVLSLFGSAEPLADTAVALPWGHLVVLRAHARAPLPEGRGADRRGAIVPDEIVWDSGSPWVEWSPFVNPPIRVGGAKVFVADSPQLTSFLLGGVLERSNGSWSIARVSFTLPDTPDPSALAGEQVVIRINRAVSADCVTSAACSPALAIGTIVWSESEGAR